jgi:hypothetical protein
MNFKTTYILFGVLFVMLAVLGFVLYNNPTPKKGAENLFPAFKNEEHKTEDVTKVVIERKNPEGPDIVFERGADKNWKIVSPRPLPVESGVVNRLIDALANAKIDEENNPPNRKEAGVDSPTRIIKLTGEKDLDMTLTVGRITPGEENAVAYVVSSARPKAPVAVRKFDLSAALEDLNYYRDKHLLGDNTGDVTGIKLSQAKKETVDFRKEGDNWRMVQPPYGDADVSDLISAISGVQVSYVTDKDNDFVKDGVTDLAKYNLDPAKGDVLRIEVTRGEGKNAKTTALLVGVGKKEKDDKFYAAIDDGKAKDVVKVSAASVEPFIKVLADPEAKRNKNLVRLGENTIPDAMDVKNTYGLLQFRKPAGAFGWELWRKEKDKEKKDSIDSNEAQVLFDALKKATVVSFPKPSRKKELGLDKPDNELDWVAIYVGSLEKPGPKKDAPPVLKKDAKPVTKLRFGVREGGNVAVERIWGKDSTIVMVPESVYDQVRRGPLAYFDKSLPAFSTGSSEEGVTKLQLTRGGEVAEIDREQDSANKGESKWKIVKPDNLKGRYASDQVVRDILTDMNRLRANEVVAEKADKAQLKRDYGLDPPSNKVVITITKDKKTTTHEYDFGKEVAGKGVYAKVGDKDTIYLLPLDALNPLKKELRDTTVFKFKASDVASVKFTGWEGLVGSPITKVMEQKDGKWVMKEPKGAPLDSSKVESLLATLSNLQADRFVKSGKGLTLKEDALQIEITLKDKKVLELTVGGADGASYYATSNQLKGDVFLLPKDLFEAVRKAPAYFNPPAK